jgi:hypothetical protein
MSQLEVCNQALQLVGQPPVVSLDEGSSQGRTLITVYQRAFSHLLASHYFPFCLFSSSLVSLTEPTPFVGYTSVRAFPTGAISIKDIKDKEGRQLDFRAGAEGIHVKSTGEVFAEYTKMVAIEATSILFRTALAYYLATQIIYSYDTSGTRQQLLEQNFNDHWKKCVSHDSLNQEIIYTNYDMITSAYYSGSPYNPQGLLQ